MSVPDEGYSRNASWALNFNIYVFIAFEERVAFFNHVNNKKKIPELETFNITTYIITRYQQTVSLDCPFLIVVSVSGLSILDCCQCLWIVHS
jgi:hypothetical protein